MNIILFYVLYGIAVIVITLWSICWISHIIALCQVYTKTNRPKSLPTDYQRPGITILKPLCGLNSNLATNLETFFNINYPNYELLFCFASEADPAVRVVQNLMKKYPKVEATLLFGATKIGVNPKVNNLHSGYNVAQYDIIMMSDDSNKIHSDTLTDMIAYMTENIALVHQLPFCCNRPGFASALEKVNLGTLTARHYLFLDFLGFIPFLSGMSAIFRKSALEQCGGLAAISGYLAEDQFLAETLMKNGYKAIVCSYPVTQNASSINTRKVYKRLVRWAHLRLKHVPLLILIEPITECFVIGPLACWAFYYILSLNINILGGILIAHVFVWFILEFILLRRIEIIDKKLEFRWVLTAWICRGIFYIFLNMIALSTRNIQWKDKLYHVSWGGKTVEVLKPTENRHKV